jgi:predicted metal-dependent hydrolase
MSVRVFNPGFLEHGRERPFGDAHHRAAGCRSVPEVVRATLGSVPWQRERVQDHVQILGDRQIDRLAALLSPYFLQRMKTKWGSCNHRARNIRLNTELVKKPKDLLEYVVVHEMLHLIAATHSEQFLALMTKYDPTWREARAELNELPLGAAVWNE